MTLVFRRFVLLFAGFAAGSVFLVAAANFVIDPYGLWRAIEIRGFNAAKSERRNQAHLFKSSDLRGPLPPVLIIGSSRTAYGIDPTHSVFENAGGAYNAASPGGHLKVIRQYLELAISSNPGRIRTVIYGLDFFEFNQFAYKNLPITYSEEQLRPGGLPINDLINALLTLDSLQASVATVYSNIQDPNYQPFYANGQLTAIDMRKSVESRGIMRRFKMTLNSYLNRPTRLRQYRWSDEAFANFVRIVEICREQKIDLMLFVTPTHAAHMEAIHARGLWKEFESWKERIATISAYWDFSGYNSVTTEPVNQLTTGYWDISHYRSSIGDLILERVFGAEVDPAHSDFGQKVTADEIDLALNRATEGRDNWLRSNSELTALIRQIMERDP